MKHTYVYIFDDIYIFVFENILCVRVFFSSKGVVEVQ
jgi:hypothetical protein